MSSHVLVTNKFRQSNAEKFHDSFAVVGITDPDYYYIFIGRPQAWIDEEFPPNPTDTIVSEYEIYRDMIAAKLITISDVSYVIRRINWTTDTVYDMYHHNVSATSPSTSGATNLWDSNLYVITDEYKVYLCISNNNGGASTYTPTGMSTNIFSLGDGYKWKYLYTLDTTAINKYLTRDFIPILQDSGVENTATKGSIDNIEIVFGGSGYLNGTHNIAINGDGSAGTVDIIVSNNIITSIIINSGLNYTFASIDLSGIEDSTKIITNAELDIIISPSYGHGGNNNKELGAFSVMINTTLNGLEGSGDFIVDQDFRRLGLIKNPQVDLENTALSHLSCLKSLNLSNVNTNFINDEIITGSDSSSIGYVVDYTVGSPVTEGVLKYIQQSEEGYGLSSDGMGNIDMFTTADTITGATSSASGIVSSVSSPEIDVYSGDIIYVENNIAIPRTADQRENIKLIVEF